jgi:asparagine synthase (glutamine-hydrolysing)
MCGIAGFVTTAPVTGGVAQLGRMTDVIRHRGPDDFGFYHDDWAHLGHRRLSIVDIAGGHQPMPNETRTLWITYNGEVYNHADLRPHLERDGHHYATRSDTETILHAFEQHGADCVQLFHGMFAFAIWDSQRRRLFCARDRLGIKPFYYYWDGRLFAFASEIKALLEHSAISASMDEELLPEVLAFGYTSGDRTLFANIRKLPPGHYLTLNIADESPGLSISRYWDVPAAGIAPDVSEQVWIAETRRRLEQAVQTRLMSDVPLGVFLSGGVDSSAIAALVQQSAAEPIQTFAVGYDEPKFSELSYASRVARSIGTEHREIVIGVDDFFSALPRLIWHEDEPIAWPSSVSLYFVSKLASEHVKVVLTGEGSDELFGGYERYRWHLLNRRAAAVYGIVPRALRRWVRQAARSRLFNASLRRKLGHTLFARENTIESLFLDNFYGAFPEEAQFLRSTPSRAMYDSYLQYWNIRAEGSLLDRMLYADQKTYLVELLMKQDQMSMACSIESRVPFLDHTFVEFAMTIPDSTFCRAALFIARRWASRHP